MIRFIGLGIASIALAACESGDAQQQNAGGEANAAEASAAPTQPFVRTADDAQLQWGPCPEVFPEGCQIAVLQGDPAKPNADMLLKVPGGSTIPAHTHTSAERMVLVEGALEVKYQNAPPVLMRDGSYAYGPAGLPHRAQCRSSDPCVLFIAFEQPVDVEPFEGEVN